VALRMNSREVNGILVVDLNGRITLGEGCEQLSQLLGDAVAKGQKKILLNLAEVPFIDSAGIGALTKGLLTARRQGGTMKLVHLTKNIRDLLQITNLYQVFEVFADEPAATASFR
jgi:anti-sigma B factor antagonist